LRWDWAARVHLVKSQFLASQLAMTADFLPAMMLSGFIYDLRSMPAFIRGITYACRPDTRSRCCKRCISPATWQRDLAELGRSGGDGHGTHARTRLATRKQLS
jgi:hypothetical protein